tara:strand:+ start:177 stop:299 length:123 start_codon:yes stop_codon:yes gene_type:complete
MYAIVALSREFEIIVDVFMRILYQKEVWCQSDIEKIDGRF